MLAPAALIALALTMTACSSPDAAGGSTGGSSGGPGTSATAPTSGTDNAPDNAPDTASENGAGREANDANTAPRSTDPATCLLGAWTADNAFFLVSLREFGDEFHSVSGTVTLDFDDDGSLTTTYQDWLLEAVVEGLDVSISRNGSDAGVFTVNGDKIDLSDTQVGSSMSVTTAGVTMPIVPDAIAYSGATFTCDTTAASITTIDGILRLNR